MTLTQVGEDWHTVRARMKRLRYDLVQDLGVRVEWCWSVEPNPKGTGHHVHAWQRGDFISQARLSDLADSKGMGYRVDIRRWHENGGEAYAMKGVGYGMKGAEASAAGAAFLENNGGRLTHSSRGFFAGGVRECERLGVERARAAGEARTWEVVTVQELHDAIGSPAPRLGGG